MALDFTFQIHVILLYIHTYNYILKYKIQADSIVSGMNAFIYFWL